MGKRIGALMKAEWLLCQNGKYCEVRIGREDDESSESVYLRSNIYDYKKYVADNYPGYKYLMRLVKAPAMDDREHYTLLFS